MERSHRALRSTLMSFPPSEKVPLMLDHGGWIPSADHSVPHDVPLANYQLYLDLTREYMERK